MGRSERLCGLLLCAALSVSACGAGDDVDAAPTSATTTTTTTAETAEFPLEFEYAVPSVAVGPNGLYIAEFGPEKSVGPTGRVLLVDDSSVVTDFADEIRLPTAVAVAPDGSVYLTSSSDDGSIWHVTEGAGATKLPLDIEEPKSIAVGPSGEIVVIGEYAVNFVPAGSTDVTTVPVPKAHDIVAIAPDGSVFYTDGLIGQNIGKFDSGSTQPQPFLTREAYEWGIVGMTFDAGGDRYVLEEACVDQPSPGPIRPCETPTFALQRFAGDSTTPTAVPVDGLTEPTSIAVDAQWIYVADGTRVVRFPKP